MKKNEEPHFITVVFSNQNDVGIDSFNCSCAAGKGLCQHTIGLLYALNHYQLLGLKSVPPIILFFGENRIFKVELNCVWVWE